MVALNKIYTKKEKRIDRSVETRLPAKSWKLHIFLIIPVYLMREYFLFAHEENKWYSWGKTLSIKRDTKRSETIQEWQLQFVFNIELRWKQYLHLSTCYMIIVIRMGKFCYSFFLYSTEHILLYVIPEVTNRVFPVFSPLAKNSTTVKI